MGEERGTECRVHCDTSSLFLLSSLFLSLFFILSFLPPHPLPPLLPSPLYPLLGPPSSLPLLLLSPLLIGPVKKCGLLKILHERYRSGPSKQRVSLELQEFRQTLQEVAEKNRDLQPHIAKAQVMGMRP